MAKGETPVRDPYSQGSIMFDVIISTDANSTTVQISVDQSGDTAKARNIGKAAARTVPI